MSEHHRRILTYARRGSRLTPRRERAWAAYADDWVISAERLRADGWDQERWFGRRGRLIVEIGAGVGEATSALAAARPDADVLAVEVWLPGIASGLQAVAEAGLGNVRFVAVDAVWAMAELFTTASIAELWTFFPDPWHKSRHHKRRLIQPDFARVAADRLELGARWRLATDWSDYAEQMVAVLDAEPGLRGGAVGRWAERPVTKFERKGIAAGRPITDLCYVREPAG